MSLEVCILASGSSGNSIYVASEKTRILVDAGLSAKQVAVRLDQIGVVPESINGICVSHEHGDHVAGIRVLQKRHGIPVYANAGTLNGIMRQPKASEISAKVFQTGAPFMIGDITIEPFSVPHDAYEPVGFRLQTEKTAVGIVTDLGMSTSLIREKLKGCRAIIMESNHDEDLLREAPRPWSLKQRIRSRQGHLSNTDAARLIAECATDALEHVFLSHLSSDCNTPDTALRTVASQLRLDGLGHIKLEISHASRISSIWNRGGKKAGNEPSACLQESGA
ncbi:MBL fold metallo-hydrolase [Pontiella sulfatireligans]|uniref:Metallo-hydrolase YycJ n=1 Tax=Pontiella sulfatireligans TaxID=2750658 RepID=A0A6C2UPJ3_9BACT|nr:MBL fold metallo-hydrolase [Pontiella sulfatireligans]VGO21191.1 Putative metallo-hydrolase YycJ [Pontiella sulfatireligans]